MTIAVWPFTNLTPGSGRPSALAELVRIIKATVITVDI
jgi:hypothetical protein